MKLFITAILALLTSTTFSQATSGNYGSLKLAYNPQTRMITGFFSESGSKKASISCEFYIKGVLKDTVALIETYSPVDKYADYVIGTMTVKGNEVAIQLSSEHFGCSNSSAFSKNWVTFTLQEKNEVIEIRYINADKTALYAEAAEGKSVKAFKKGAVVFVDKIEGEWAHITVPGKTVLEGWVKVASLNN